RCSPPASGWADRAAAFAGALTRLAFEVLAKGACGVTGDASGYLRQAAAGIDHRLHLVAQQIALRGEEVARRTRAQHVLHRVHVPLHHVLGAADPLMPKGLHAAGQYRAVLHRSFQSLRGLACGARIDIGRGLSGTLGTMTHFVSATPSRLCGIAAGLCEIMGRGCGASATALRFVLARLVVLAFCHGPVSRSRVNLVLPNMSGQQPRMAARVPIRPTLRSKL